MYTEFTLKKSNFVRKLFNQRMKKKQDFITWKQRKKTVHAVLCVVGFSFRHPFWATRRM